GSALSFHSRAGELHPATVCRCSPTRGRSYSPSGCTRGGMSPSVVFLTGPLFALSALACGGNVLVDGNGGGAGAGGATGPTTTGTTMSTATSSSSSSSTSTSGAGCVDQSSLSVIESNGVNNGGPQPLSSICANAPWNPQMSKSAIAYLVKGGPPPGMSTLTL